MASLLLKTRKRYRSTVL
uniref:Uncharacterized protein n=1 Tax=Anguilla anguilla TaxID=7936 RepID=A0A0E9PSS8_ANGAN